MYCPHLIDWLNGFFLLKENGDLYNGDLPCVIVCDFLALTPKSPKLSNSNKTSTQILFSSPQYPGKKQFNLEDYPEVPAHVRLILWLGLEKHQEAWTNRQETEGDFCVFAETV